MDESSEEERTVWCGNLSDKVSEEVLYELFLQAAPLERVRIPKDKDGRQNNYGFVTFRNLVSVQYAVDLLNGTPLFDRRINLKPRVGSRANQPPPINVPTCILPSPDDVIKKLTMLGDRLLNQTPTRGHNLGHNNYSPAPYNRWDRGGGGYRGSDRHEDNSHNYRRRYHNSDRRPYHGGNRFLDR